MRVLVWHVHGAWTTAFVQGPFDVVVPVVPDRGPRGRGRPDTYAWPEAVREVASDRVRDEDVDVVVLQRPDDARLLREWTGLEPGRDVPAVYVEHNTPPGPIALARHPVADRSDIPLVHVTSFNRLMWDAGHAPTVVIEHGIPDPGERWTGELLRAGVVVNEPIRRARVTGADLVPVIASAAPVDAFGIGTEDLTRPAPAGRGSLPPFEVVGHGDVAHDAMLDELARRRVYVHLCRWTSLGLSLLEAMHLGMPVVSLATTEVPEALAGSGVVMSNDPDRLAALVRVFVHDRDAAAAAGAQVRTAARERYSLARFHADWERLLKEVTA